MKEEKEDPLKKLRAKVNRNETKIKLTNMRINRIVDAIDKSRRLKGL